ncbi:MAG: phosphotransferase [Actinobacteria bacterium]|nr:phosphotransferase [Actinomycetota bacterium]MBO0788068.1 phosphotransferase [Actinomycetota bacterium]MBO0816527.1 phosphotransferase [Actinomycetota bacterium]
MTGPPAEGARVHWQDVPEQVRTEIERACGAAVAEAATAPGGFSPGLAARVRCADGRRWFVKAASGEVNPDTPRLHRQEARILGELDPLIRSGQLPAARLRATVEHGSWFALILDDVDGRQPALPWQDEQVGQVLGTLDTLADVLTPAPGTAPSIEQYLGTAFTGWRSLAQGPGDDRLDPWSRARLADLAALEATWAAHTAGTTLLHGDIRADNVLVTGRGVVVIDWPHACHGAAFADVVLLAPSVAMQGGPQPAELLARSRAARSASRAGLTALVCALAGYFTARSLRPPPPGIPAVRAFQAAQGEVTRRWLAQLL